MIKTPQKLDFFLSNFWGAVHKKLDTMRFIVGIFTSFSPEIEFSSAPLIDCLNFHQNKETFKGF